MTEKTDPRALGFNYGAAIGAPRDNPAYAAAEALRTHCLSVLSDWSKRAWDLEIATRDVRIACTPEEQAAKLETLSEVYNRIAAETGHVPTAERFYSHADLASIELRALVGAGKATVNGFKTIRKGCC